MRFPLLVSSLLVLASPVLCAFTVKEDPALKQPFLDRKLPGVFVLYDPAADTMIVSDAKRANERFIPASTFKIVNALIGLDAGTVKNVDEVLPYGGKPQPFKDWERDMNLRDAMRVSNLPVYQELARRTGKEKMTAAVKRLGYGNQDTGKTVDRFWLEGPLRISAVEQAEFLFRLTHGKLPVKPEAAAAVKDITLIEKTDAWSLHGKTGWVFPGPPQTGWWVGWVERGGESYPFAVNIDMAGKEDIPKRLEIGRECLKLLGKL